jgi:hypothetical protein
LQIAVAADAAPVGSFFGKNIGTSSVPVGFVRAPSGRKLQPQTGFMDMMYRLIAASMLTLALGTSAIAQSSTTGTSDTSGATTATPGATDTMMMTEADKELTSDWSGPIADAFFADASKTELKSQDEIRSSWSSLSTEQQAQVKQDCATVSSATASAPGTGTSTDTTASTTTPSDSTASGTSTDTTASTTPDTSGPAAGTSTDTTASTTTGTDTTSSDMAASGTAGSGTYSTAMTELCSMVESM